MSTWAKVAVSNSRAKRPDDEEAEVTMEGPNVTGSLILHLGDRKITVAHHDLAEAIRRLAP